MHYKISYYVCCKNSLLRLREENFCALAKPNCMAYTSLINKTEISQDIINIIDTYDQTSNKYNEWRQMVSKFHPLLILHFSAWSYIAIIAKLREFAAEIN